MINFRIPGLKIDFKRSLAIFFHWFCIELNSLQDRSQNVF